MPRNGRRQGDSAGAGASGGPWRLVLLLVVAVAVPSVCVLWFMNQAVHNEGLAVRQKLIEAYEPQLKDASAAVAGYWQERADALQSTKADAPAPERFAALVTSGACAGAVIYDNDGAVAYPSEPPPDAEPVDAWAEARALQDGGDKAGAVKLLTGLFTDPTGADARDPGGRLIGPLAALRALELAPKDDLRDALVARLNDYSGPAMPPSERRFLMRRLQDAAEFPTLGAEELAADYLARHPSAAEPGRLAPSGLPGVWRMASGGAVGLFREDGFLPQMRAMAAKSAVAGTTVALLAPGQADGEAFLTAPLGDALPGWRLALRLEGEDPFGRAAGQRVAAYLWASLLSVGAIVLIALVAGRYLLRQARLTRLKNDFIATVTHELKTPLASVRLFAETLREGRYEDEAQAARYLDLLVRENERLSRLIDNFLGFSRMERNKQAFDFAPARPAALIETAAEAVRQRFGSDDCRFDVDVPPDLPAVDADADAMVTVLLNLLDNAWKYSGEGKRIALRARVADGQVCFEVEDNGIGMTRRQARRAFERFYQADSRLSRGAGGCGLGLSIVKFIVDAHGGTVDVRSEPGKGSTFTVRLPAAGPPPTAPGEDA